MLVDSASVRRQVLERRVVRGRRCVLCFMLELLGAHTDTHTRGAVCVLVQIFRGLPCTRAC